MLPEALDARIALAPLDPTLGNVAKKTRTKQLITHQTCAPPIVGIGTEKARLQKVDLRRTYL